MSDTQNRIRLLKLREILLAETDEDHELSLDQLGDKLKLHLGSEFTIQNRALVADIEALLASGFDVVKNVMKFGKIYYSHQHRLFETYELRMFIDAIISARFITTSESTRLVEKIKKLASAEEAKKLQSRFVVDKTIKSENTYMKLNMDKLHIAIADKKMVRFQYGNYNVAKEFNLHKQGGFYEVMPYAQVWSQDYYYLIGKYMETETTRHYRVDRMREVQVGEGIGNNHHFEIADYLQKTFHMYPGEVKTIHIQCKNQLVNVMIDRFGKDVDIQKADDETFLLKTKAAISEGLKRWILTWGGDVKVLAPIDLAESIMNEINKMKNLYSI